MRLFVPDPHDRIKGPNERCQDCGAEFNAHTNGRCPPEEEPQRWWGYRHVLGSAQAKRFWGDRASLDDAYDSDFVDQVIEPFEAGSRDEALAIVSQRTTREPPEPDGEAFRGGEAAAYLAEQQDAARRLK